MARSGKRRILLAAIAATSLLVAALLAYHIAQRASLPAPPATGPVAATAPNSPAGSANPLALSRFDQPRELPEIHFADGADHELTLADFRGRVVLLNLWATWCVPCRREMPALDRLQAMLGGEGFLVLPLSIDRQGAAAVKRFYQQLGINSLGIYVDPRSEASRALAIPGLPVTLLIDRQGREIAREMGPAEWDGPQTVSLIRRMVNPKSGEARDRDR